MAELPSFLSDLVRPIQPSEGRLGRAFRLSTVRDIARNDDGDFPPEAVKGAVRTIALDQRGKRKSHTS